MIPSLRPVPSLPYDPNRALIGHMAATRHSPGRWLMRTDGPYTEACHPARPLAASAVIVCQHAPVRRLHRSEVIRHMPFARHHAAHQSPAPVVLALLALVVAVSLILPGGASAAPGSPVQAEAGS